MGVVAPVLLIVLRLIHGVLRAPGDSQQRAQTAIRISALWGSLEV